MTDRTEATPAGYVPPADDSTDLLPPALIDGKRYTLVRKLGGGGMGVVYLLHNVRMDRLEVVKLIRPDGLGSAELTDRFRQEVRAAGQLNHPNVVIGYGTDEIDGTLVLAMEFVDGTDLAELVKMSGPLSVGKACEYARQAALGLQHAHDRGLVHRDVKPHNLLLRREGGQEWVKVIDFGLVKAAALDHLREERTQAEQLLGSPPYMAPEQWAGASAVESPADIYALGCVLYFLLAGRPPFAHHQSRHTLMLAHVSEEPPPIADLPAGLESVLGRMLAKAPEDRPLSAAEVAALLAPFTASGYQTPPAGRPPEVDERGSTATYRPTPPPRPNGSRTDPLTEAEADARPASGWKRPAVFAGGAVAVVAAAWLTVWAIGGRPADEQALLPSATGTDKPQATAPDKPVPAPAIPTTPAKPALKTPEPVRPVSSEFARNEPDGWQTANAYGGGNDTAGPIQVQRGGSQYWVSAARNPMRPPFFWSAPDKYLGAQSDKFGKWLTFKVKAAGPPAADVQNGQLVSLRKGPPLKATLMLFVLGRDVKPVTLPNGWRGYAVRLDHTGGWRVRASREAPAAAFEGPPASDEQIQSALDGLSALLIRGEFADDKTGSLAGVVFGADGPIETADLPPDLPADPKPPVVKPADPPPAPRPRKPVRSDFGQNDADGWTTGTGGNKPGGTRPIGFDHSGGQWWVKATRAGPDPFHWVAPEKFHGDHSDKFGKWLVWYTFAPKPVPPGVLDDVFVAIRGNGGALMVKGKDVKQRVNEYNWRVCSVRLDSSGRWGHSPRRGVPPTAASDADIKGVLSNVGVLHIHGEYNGLEGTLDMVTFGADEVPK